MTEHSKKILSLVPFCGTYGQLKLLEKEIQAVLFNMAREVQSKCWAEADKIANEKEVRRPIRNSDQMGVGWFEPVDPVITSTAKIIADNIKALTFK